jgi:hypothetical protein
MSRQKLGPAARQVHFTPRIYLPVVLAIILTVMLAGRRIDVSRAAACVTNPVVTTNADSGPGSLRDAIANACSGSTITFANTVVSPIVLQTELAIDANLTIQGPGASVLTVSGNNSVRVFNIGSVTAAISVTISGLTISDGNGVNAGAGIFSAATGTVNISEVTVSNNTVNGRVLGDGGGIISIGGTMNITNSTISGNVAAAGSGNNGGGVENDAGMNITGCTITGNSAPFTGNGAGVANFGGMTIANSTINGNTAGGQARGGGIFNQNTLTVINSTITGNSASGGSGGGGILSVNNALLINDTIVGNLGDNGGGVYQFEGTVTVQNTIIALNSTNGLGPDTFSVNGFTSQGFNLIGKGDGASGFTNGVNGDQVGSNASPLDPKVQLDMMGNPLLQNNGGPTETVALLAGSPAIDNGSDSVLGPPESLTTDQRGLGFPRKLCMHVDIGAYEFKFTGAPTIDCPGNMSVGITPDQTSASASFSASASDFCDGPVPTTFKIGSTAITSPHTFPVGVTTVTISATSPTTGMTGTCSFTVTVAADAVCMKDDHTGNLFQFNTQTGAYTYTNCSNNTTVSGTGKVTTASGMITLTDTESTRKISASFSPSQLTGRANITLIPAPGIYQTITVSQTNPRATCSCGV